MFSKDNIKSIRFSNPQNDTVEVQYIDDEDRTLSYWFPVIPYNSVEWFIVKDAGFDFGSIYKNTLSWIEERKLLEPTIIKKQYTKLNYVIENNNVKVKLHKVTDHKFIDFFITKSNNPMALLEKITLPNTKDESVTFEITPVKEKVSIYLVE